MPPGDSSTFFTVFFTGIIALSSCLTFGAICFQAWIYNCQLKEMRKSSDAATQAAKAAEDSVSLARQNAHLDQRAWLNFVNIGGLPVINERFHIHFEVKNTGKTFAKKVSSTPIAQPVDGEDVPDFPAKVERARKESQGGINGTVSNAMISPGGSSAVNLFVSDGPLSEEGINNLKSRKQRIFVYAKVWYEDIFKCAHWTTACWVLEQTKGGDWFWAAYTTYNDADEGDCASETSTSPN
jgi:hypothetical protein